MTRYSAFCSSQRIAQRITSALDSVIPGILEFRELLTRSAAEGEVWLPQYERSDDGEWSVVGFEPAEELRGALPAE
ncbi:MAG TPA: hypothetical protein VI299_09015 [Polyangiales bacterium]